MDIKASRRCPARRKTNSFEWWVRGVLDMIIIIKIFIHETWSREKGRSRRWSVRARIKKKFAMRKSVGRELPSLRTRRDARDILWKTIIKRVPSINRTYTRRRLCLRISNVCCCYCFLLVRNDDRARIDCELQRRDRSFGLFVVNWHTTYSSRYTIIIYIKWPLKIPVSHQI